ncbi:antitoxin [Gryllotalpicola protaetiae]|uniref:Antitoxin n=1 Tax=Gryllotalpicola protaetiae TaxID=2419771 RepID=A0A387BJL5_9MICO|nr:antitoxin [Gryllotalpicola protaetiae]AYG02918.1 antitoxin [Gryllotalpicola protaetiae]
MGLLDDAVDKAKGFLGTDQGEQVSDNVLDGAADKASDLTGGKFEDQIKQGQQAADNAIGN